MSSAAPPLVICGKRIQQSASGAVVVDASARDVTVQQVTSGGLIYLRLSRDCHAHVGLAIVPPETATIVDQSPTRNPVVVALRPNNLTFAVEFKRPSGRGRVDVRLTEGDLQIAHPYLSSTSP